ncbi:uncharacterized protein LOC105663768 [Megachile rotundata]|uniref:uncharacterized protein LOC105663768 n=1 Tax=Megachile rotundata TaxID=143995 RepID=UPI00061506E1|nr:PREDICTED: uncharacterized protein LOC105663768 isoform X2 [Megachile rotundata]
MFPIKKQKGGKITAEVISKMLADAKKKISVQMRNKAEARKEQGAAKAANSATSIQGKGGEGNGKVGTATTGEKRLRYEGKNKEDSMLVEAIESVEEVVSCGSDGDNNDWSVFA